uniref:Uncharacterized protein n=1 Tax=Romanomermis culicivorax TaxID=13658 RepID=A0A915IGA1_ROMCU
MDDDDGHNIKKIFFHPRKLHMYQRYSNDTLRLWYNKPTCFPEFSKLYAYLISCCTINDGAGWRSWLSTTEIGKRVVDDCLNFSGVMIPQLQDPRIFWELGATYHHTNLGWWGGHRLLEAEVKASDREKIPETS